MLEGRTFVVRQRSADRACVEITVSDLGYALADELDEELEQAHRTLGRWGRVALVVDFHNVRWISSYALGSLLAIRNRLLAFGGSLELCAMRPEVYDVFVTTRLATILPIHSSVESAMGNDGGPEDTTR